MRINQYWFRREQRVPVLGHSEEEAREKLREFFVDDGDFELEDVRVIDV